MKQIFDPDDLPDPEYENPLGKLPGKPRQPFDFDEPLMHTDAERKEWERDALSDAARKERRVMARELTNWINYLSKWHNSLIRRLLYAENSRDKALASRCRGRIEVAKRAEEVWAIELAMLVEPMCHALADMIEKEFSSEAGKEFVNSLRENRDYFPLN